MADKEEEKARRIEQLRSQAEGRLHQQELPPQGTAASDPALYNLQRLVHEMRVYQVELEMQNEELIISRVQLEQSRNEYSTLYESAPVGYFTLNHYGQILRVNQMGCGLLGYARASLVKRPFRSMVVPAQKASFDYFIKRLFETAGKQSGESELIQPGGKACFVHLEAQVVQPAGEPARCLLAVMDVTARKEAENELRQSKAALHALNEQLESLVAERTRHLEQALETLREQAQQFAKTNRQLERVNADLTGVNTDLDNFIYTASHDLKSPILNIEGLLHALLKALPPEVLQSEKVQQITHYMQDSVNRFRSTIADLTEVTKLQREEAHGYLADLPEVLREVLLDLQPVIEQTNARIVMETETCLEVRCSKKNLRSVVYNLLSNALKYRDLNRPPEVHIRCGKTPGYALFSVQDNGLGIDPKEQDRVFGMFKRFHVHVEGTGIGLYMVKKIIDNAGGKIALESRPGKGSTFTVYLPQ